MLGVASWMVDAAALRDTLDRLRTALQSPVSVVKSAGLGHDQTQVTSSLRQILKSLDGVDWTARQVLSGFIRALRSESQSQSLRDLLDGIQEGWRKRVTRILGEEKLVVLHRLLGSPTPDLLRILGREDDENSHSDLIAWLLTPRRAPTVAPFALRRLVSCFENASDWHARIDSAVGADLISVRREMLIARELSVGDDLCRVDIVASGPGFVLAIENKVWSHEHSDQTTTYWEWLEPMSCLRGGLFLSPSGLTATCSNFSAVSYLDLVAALLEGPASRPITPTEEVVLASYLKTLARYIVPVEMRAASAAARAIEEAP
jgi:hypothetical protein